MPIPEGFGEELFEFLVTPAFGAHSKREIEFKVFELLYREALLGGTGPTASEVSARLRVTRARARQLLLEARLRLEGHHGETREAMLRRVLPSWVQHPVEFDSDRLTLVVADPWMREAVRGYAADKLIVLDGSFNSELVKFTWSSYVALLRALHGELDVRDWGAMGAELRATIAEHESLDVAFRDELAARLDENVPAGSFVSAALAKLRKNPALALQVVQALARLAGTFT